MRGLDYRSPLSPHSKCGRAVTAAMSFREASRRSSARHDVRGDDAASNNLARSRTALGNAPCSRGTNNAGRARRPALRDSSVRRHVSNRGPRDAGGRARQLWWRRLMGQARMGAAAALLWRRRLSRLRLVNQRIGFLRFAAAVDLHGVWHGWEVSGCGER